MPPLVQISLKEIFAQLPIKTSEIIEDRIINGIVSDSRVIQPGNLFVAIPGNITDGHRFISDAVAKGAAAVVGTNDIATLDIPYIRVENSKRALAHLAAAFHGFPAKKLTIIGVTGTDGKTTTTNLIYEILRSAGIPSGMISTVNAVVGDRLLDTGFHVTTPDAPDIQRYLASMVDSGLTHVILEATSHGLAQYRLEACEFDIGVVTNITHEHLDFHETYENYRAAKAKLLDYLVYTVDKPAVHTRAAVINRDDRSYPFLAQRVDIRKISYGFNRKADVKAENISQDQSGWTFDLVIQDNRHRITTNLVGLYNIFNCLAAITSTVVALNVDIHHAISALASFRGVAGRMEAIDLGQDFLAIVDFAHTPNALKCSLETAHTLTNGNLIAVFGSAGLRDRAKRRLMAETSIRLADLTIFTAEDPRTEPLTGILDEMAAGARSRGGLEGKDFWRIQDRGAAIQFALELANPGDLVIICGKGHEQSMCFGETEYAWDDRTALKAALSQLLGLPGPDMPYLPTQDQ
jgi:UDP-N-acetylmuramoyl-L-alanyl-D-glutamate--2,6-diaminopimelate ligase